MAKAKHTKVSEAVAHIRATFNNTIVTIADRNGNVLAWGSAGKEGFKGSRKSTPHAGKIAAEGAIARAVKKHGVENLTVRICGPGPGRESAARGLVFEGVNITEVSDVTTTPHNGVRQKGERSG